MPLFGHQPTGGHGARERDQGQAPILEHAVAHHAAAAHDEEEDGGMTQLLQYLVGHPHHSYGSQRSSGDDGFHTAKLPTTAAMNAFQDQTADGKLKAVITPMAPRGCHCSCIR